MENRVSGEGLRESMAEKIGIARLAEFTSEGASEEMEAASASDRVPRPRNTAPRFVFQRRDPVETGR